MPIKVSQKMLAQSSPPSTNKSPFYKPPVDTETEVRTVVVANITGSAASFSLYFNNQVDTLDDAHALYKSNSVAANSSTLIQFNEGNGLILDNTSATLGVESHTASAFTYTVFGTETKIT